MTEDFNAFMHPCSNCGAERGQLCRPDEVVIAGVVCRGRGGGPFDRMAGAFPDIVVPETENERLRRALRNIHRGLDGCVNGTAARFAATEDDYSEGKWNEATCCQAVIKKGAEAVLAGEPLPDDWE